MELQVGAHDLQIEQHLAEISGNGDLRYRISELAVLNPQPGGAARVIAGDHADAGTDQLRNVEAIADSSNDLIGRALTRLDIEIPLADVRTPGKPAAGVPRGAQPKPSRRVGVDQIAAQNATLHHHCAARR